MPEALSLNPDREFVDAVMASGGGDLKKCYQCATCAVVCELACEDHAFPRKEMHWAQWGLKERLVNDPDIWLCHQCNDCSLRCPRGARPGDVLAAIRKQTIQHFAFPKAVARWVSSVRATPVMLILLPALLLAAALLVRDPLANALGLHGGHEAFYAQFFPHWLLIGFYTGFTLLAFAGLAVGLVRFWKGMRAHDEALGRPAPDRAFMPSLLEALGDIFMHRRFGDCGDQKQRRTSHLLAFYGFLALFVVTVWAVVDLYVMPGLGVESLYPFDLSHPMKILANIGGVILVVGTGKAIWDRISAPEDGKHQSTAFDWIFVWLLFWVGVTGFATQAFRFTVTPETMGAYEYVAYAVYFTHLVLVFGLLVYLPYSKFAHMWYRTLAMTYAGMTGRVPHSQVKRLMGEGGEIVTITAPDPEETGDEVSDAPEEEDLAVAGG
ncbi:MAG: quinone-interacting membrane-bound oxidoreductase complex subunit QmoC [Longimicrobiales bacterium]